MLVALEFCTEQVRTGRYEASGVSNLHVVEGVSPRVLDHDRSDRK